MVISADWEVGLDREAAVTAAAEDHRVGVVAVDSEVGDAAVDDPVVTGGVLLFEGAVEVGDGTVDER